MEVRFPVKGTIYYVGIAMFDLFACEDNMFLRKRSPGISLVLNVIIVFFRCS